MKTIGVDIGTTNIKVIVYDATLREVVVTATEPTPVHQDGSGYVHNPLEIRTIVYRLIKDAVKSLEGASDIASLSVASFGEEIILLDEADQPVGDALTWYDPRGVEEAEAFLRDRTVRELYKEIIPDPSFSLFKMLWLLKHRPEQLQRSRSMIDFGGYILGGLCGNYVMDWSHASRTGCFDLFHRKWNEPILAKAGLDSSICPVLAPSGVSIGVLSEAAQAELGLPKGIKLVTGGHDHLCGAYAAGIREQGELFLSAGTSEAHLILVDRPITEGNSSCLLDQGCFVDDKHYYVMSSIPSGHVFGQWKRLLYDNTGEDEMYEEIAQLPAGSGGVRFHLSEDLKRVSLENLPYTSGRNGIMRAILEGLAVKSAAIVSELKSFAKMDSQSLLLSGHPTRIKLWKDIRSAIYSRELTVIEEKETTALGAAFLALRVVDEREHLAARSEWRQDEALVRQYDALRQTSLLD